MLRRSGEACASLPGLDRLVVNTGFESWLERDHVMALDFDPAMVVGIVSQPFWLRWADEAGVQVSHATDFFARRADGLGVVVDCRPVERRPVGTWRVRRDGGAPGKATCNEVS